MSDLGSTVEEIAAETLMHEEYVRELIRRFNREGLAMLRERPRTGRPVEFVEELQAEIVQFALAPPKLLGRPFTVWSLEKLKEYLLQAKVVKAISIETLRSILHQHGVRLQRTKTWKESNNPEFGVKKKRLTRLYRQPPAGCHVICFDEFAPIELRPIHGPMWAQQGQVDHLPATYPRPHGVRHFLAFYDVQSDELWGYFRCHKCWKDVLTALQRLRARYPAEDRLYVILDNFAPHRRPEIRQWARKNKIVLVWTPTYASWLNKIECQFTELRRFVFHNSNYQAHTEMRIAVLKFLRYRNTRNRERKLTDLKRH